MIRPTARGVTLLAVAVSAYGAARVLGTWELYLIALAFAAMTGVAWGTVIACSGRLEVHRSVHPEQPIDGDLLEMSFRVRSGRWLPGLRITLSGATGRLMDRAADPVVIEGLGLKADRAVIAGPWPANRGIYHLPAFTALVEDALGLVRIHRAAGEPLRITVVPRLQDLATCAVCAEGGTRHLGGRRRLPARDAGEFRGVRPHVPGESLDRIDWKSTAKTGQLMLREMEADADDDLTVLLSGTGGGDAGGAPDLPFETAVRVAGSMSAFMLQTGHAVSLLLPERDWRPIRLTPKSSSTRRLLAVLAEAESSDPGRLGRSLQAIIGGRAQARRCILVLVVLRLDLDLVHALLQLRGEGIPVSVVHIRGDEDGASGLHTARGDEAHAVSDGDLGRALNAAGVRYVSLDHDADLRAALAVGPVSRRR